MNRVDRACALAKELREQGFVTLYEDHAGISTVDRPELRILTTLTHLGIHGLVVSRDTHVAGNVITARLWAPDWAVVIGHIQTYERATALHLVARIAVLRDDREQQLALLSTWMLSGPSGIGELLGLRPGSWKWHGEQQTR